MTQRAALVSRERSGGGDRRSVMPSASSVANAWWIVPLVIIAVLLGYANSFPGSFYFDDDAAIVQNRSIRDLSDWRQVLWPPIEAGIGGRPFANVSYALNYAFGGQAPGGYHAVNVAIHAAAAALLFLLTRRTLLLPILRPRFGHMASGIAVAASLLWALHPLQTNVVNYMSQRTEGLMGALYLLTIYAFVRSAESESRGWSALAFVACALGMATKEVMVTAPVIALLYDRTFIGGSFSAALRHRWRKHALLASTWILLAGLMYASKLSERGVGFGLGQSAYAYALTECRAVIKYLQLSVWPYPLVFDYGPNYLQSLGQVWPSALLLFSALAATAIALWRVPAVGFAFAWFFVLLAPSSSIIPVVQQPCAENRVYLPLVGIMALVAVGSSRILGRHALAGMTFAVVALGTATALRNPVFRNELAIWWDTTVKRPDNARSANNLGNALLKTGRVDEALTWFETAIKVSPAYADAHNNRGVILLRKNRPEEALVEFRTAITQKDKYADAYYNIGEALLQMRRQKESIPPLRKALELDPTNAKAYNNIGVALLDTGQVEESIVAERNAIKYSPNMPDPHYNLANSLARAGQINAALAEYDETLRLDPKFAKAHNNAGVLLLQMGHMGDAGARFEAALRIDPGYADAKSNLELVRSRTP